VAPTPPGPTAWDPQNPTAKFYPTSRPHFSFLGEWKPGYACQVALAGRGFSAHCGSDEAFEDSWQKDIGIGAVIAMPLVIGLVADVASGAGVEEGGSAILRHYTTSEAASAIEDAGTIEPGASGKIWLTADRYSSAAEARSSLALPRTPSGYFEVQASRVAALRGPTIAAPKYGMPGGGSEFTTEFPIKIASPFIPFGG
jgi:hypothetical protein